MGMADVREVGQTQLGLVARRQLAALLTPRQVRLAVGRGELVPVHHDVFRIGGHPMTRQRELLAGALAAGPDALLSHRSGVEVHGLTGVSATRPEVLVLRPRQPRVPGVVVHTTDRLGDADRDVIGGLPVTSVGRTLFDVSAVVGPRALARLVDGAVRRGSVTLETLWDVHDALTGRGRRRAVTFRTVLEAWTDGVRPGDSPKEVDVARLLVRAGLPRPEQQHLVTIGGTVHELDLAWPDLRLNVEYDGWESHGGREAFERDRQRDAELTAAGWTVLRFTRSSTPTTIVRTVGAAHARLSRTLGTAGTPHVAFRGKIAG